MSTFVIKHILFIPSCTVFLNHFVCHRLSLITLIWVPTGLPPWLISLPHHLLLSYSLVRLFLHLPTLIIWAYYYNHTGGKLDSLEVVLLDRSGSTNMQTGTKLVNLLRTQTGIPFLLMTSTLHGKIGWSVLWKLWLNAFLNVCYLSGAIFPG